METMDDKIMKSLLKKATGYTYDEIVEEYVVRDEGEIALAKRKVTSKHCPPDSTAMKTYLELNQEKDISSFDDETLEKEKQRLLKLLQKNEKKSKSKNS